MASPFKPSTPYTINPADPAHPLLFFQDEHASLIDGLTIYTEANFKFPRSEFTDFLNRLHALKKLVIHWKVLNWVHLRGGSPSSAQNFPLCLLRYFTGKRLCIEATTLASAVMPVFPAEGETRRLGALTDFQIVGARNIREFRTFIEWQTDKAYAFLQSVNSLRCNIHSRDDGAVPENVMIDLGSLLLKFGAVARRLEEFRFTDWQNTSFDGLQIARSDLVSLTSLKRLHLHFGASLKGNEKTMTTLNTSFRKWLFPFLSQIPSPQILEIVDITFSFSISFPWPTDLHEWMETFAKELDVMLDSRFPRLRTANLTYDVRGAHTRPYDWTTFNTTLHPTKLHARGVACVFKTQLYRP
ncbi:hypothetical protein NP233_g9792 [Leucocoprinus birnbaumii]|uniref:Uncharacterized protein n=1 Tax=Leucocoprinus birnbaumii TaxID=56174 RepID=A0AAD5YSJ5_9AGAR|nr:hypothetical protein NP233_g9792 [Leucocoprinus birnbaumii]